MRALSDKVKYYSITAVHRGKNETKSPGIGCGVLAAGSQEALHLNPDYQRLERYLSKCDECSISVSEVSDPTKDLGPTARDDIIAGQSFGLPSCLPCELE